RRAAPPGLAPPPASGGRAARWGGSSVPRWLAGAVSSPLSPPGRGAGGEGCISPLAPAGRGVGGEGRSHVALEGPSPHPRPLSPPGRGGRTWHAAYWPTLRRIVLPDSTARISARTSSRRSSGTSLTDL